MRRQRFLLTVTCLVLGQLPASAGEKGPPRSRSRRTDCYGDPLPLGAVARIGTTRLRHPGADCLAFSPDGKLLASVGSGERLRLWEVHTGRRIPGFRHQEANCVAFSPEGKRMASGGWSGEILLWDLGSRKILRRLTGHRKSVNALTFSRDGALVASASEDQTARVWRVATGTEVWQLAAHKEDVTSVAFSRDGKALVSGGYDSMLRLWDLATGKEVRRFGKFSGRPLSLAFSPDGKTITSGGPGDGPRGPGEANVWEVSTGKRLHTLKQPTHWFAAIVSPDGKTVAADGAGSEGILLYAAATGKETGKLVMRGWGANPYAFSWDGKLLATAGSFTAIQIWDVRTGKPIHRIGGHQGEISAIVFANKGRFLATAGREGALLWDAATGKEIAVLREDQRSDQEPVLAASANGNYLAVGAQDVVLFNARTGRVLHRIDEDLLSRECLGFSPDSRSLLSASWGGSFKVWDTVTGKQSRQLGGSKEHPDLLENSHWYAIGFSESGSPITAGVDGREGLTLFGQWDWKTGKTSQLFLKRRVGGTGRQVIVSPNGRFCAYVGLRDQVHLLRPSTGREILHFKTPPVKNSGVSSVWSLAISPDGRTVATGHYDGSVRLWEVATGKERRCFVGHQDRVRALAFSPDGKRLASASIDTSVLVWAVSP